MNKTTALLVATGLLATLSRPAGAARRPELPERSGPSVDGRAVEHRAKDPPALVPVRRDALTRALERGAIDEATYALQRALSLFNLDGVRARYGAVARPPGEQATMILRDLVARLGGLSPKELQRARRVLARPDDSAPEPAGAPKYSVPSSRGCTPNFCIHWVDTTDDAPPAGDSDADSIPDYIETVAAVMEEVRAREVRALGYRAPKPDTTSNNNGGDNRFDVYVANIGADGIYGYCTTDDPNAQPGSGYRYFDVSAFCVLDDDYAEFPNEPLSSLRVTAAHEYFHAVQFSYDFLEDLWLMEGTATWIEDEVFDEVNDNYQYLSRSALAAPQVPVDYGDEGFQYGAWLWWRFLTEYLGRSGAKDPLIVRQTWENADAADPSRRGGGQPPDMYSLEAIFNALDARGLRFRFAFADFAAVNYVADAFYEEGESYVRKAGYPPELRAKITRNRRNRSGSVTLDHLTSAYATYKPGRGVGDRARLRVSVDLPNYGLGPEASIVTVKRSGALKVIALELDSQGNAVRTVGFSKSKVFSVTVVVTNASTRFVDCFRANMPYSCMGLPQDDDQVFAWQVTLL